MSLRILCTGKLYGDPVRRTGQSGSQFTTAKIACDTGGAATVWVSVIAFGDAGDQLAEARDGAALALSGRADLKVFEGKHGPQAGVDLVADQVATLKGKSRPKKSPDRHADQFADIPGCDDFGGQA